MEIPIKKIKSDVKETNSLEWTNKERKELEEKILNLRDDQIAILSYAMVKFSKEDIKYHKRHKKR